MARYQELARRMTLLQKNEKHELDCLECKVIDENGDMTILSWISKGIYKAQEHRNLTG
jgi:hypothetical protein